MQGFFLTGIRCYTMRRSNTIIKPAETILLNNHFSPFCSPSFFSTLSESLTIESEVLSILTRPNWQSNHSLKKLAPSLTPFHVTNLLNHLNLNAKTALAFFNWIEQRPGYKHDVQSYSTILNLLIRAKILGVAEKVRIAMVKSCDSEDLKVMMVANLLLMGSEVGYMNMYFRDSYMAKFFRKSFERLKPDMLIVLGDFFCKKGSDLTTNSWSSALQQFQRMLGPFLDLPLHIVIGDRDIGECSELNAKSVSRIARDLPGMDPAGYSSFEVNNISFVSLNAVAMLCGNNDLQFRVEGVIEKESV